MKLLNNLILILLMLVGFSFATLLIRPEDAVKEVFPGAKIEKKNILIPKAKKVLISKISRNFLKSSLFTVYIAKEDNKVLGYAILHPHIARTKSEVALISFDKDCNITDTELIAFYEAPEYMPSDRWMKHFDGKNKDNLPVLKQNIPNITGVTLSTQALTAAARESIAICEIILKEQFK